MKNIGKRVFTLLLAVVLIGGAFSLTASAAGNDDGVTNWDFIVPVTHQTTVPAGYLGVYNAQQLSAIRNNLNGKYILMNDIDLAAFGEWEPIGSFNGLLDGNGYVIKNLKI